MTAFLDVNVLIALLDQDHSMHATGEHEFWPDDVSLLDNRIADPKRIHGPRQVTDLYLLALEVRRGGRFVSFDASISRTAIRGAERRHLVSL